MKMNRETEEQIQAIRDRFAELNEHEREVFTDYLTAHLRSLANWRKEPMDYPDQDRVNVPFPDKIHIAYAVCHPNCGTEQFIVDGSTQECQHCGGLMFRTEVTVYEMIRAAHNSKKKDKSEKAT